MSGVRLQGALVGIAAIVSIALLWSLPAVGFVAVAVMLVIAAPWGASMGERMVVSGVVVIAAIAIIFPRASTVPITAHSSRLFLSAAVVLFTVGALVRIRLARRHAQQTARLLPGFGWLDVVVLAVLAIGLWWPISAYLGGSPQQIVSALFFGGWDNAAHFLTFANT